jgi:hypothetical protein
MKIVASCRRHLSNELVWNWSEKNWFWWIFDHTSGQRLFRFALQDDTFALGESLATFLVIGLDAGQEFVTALRGLDMFDADVDALGEDLSSVTLVDDDSQCVLCHIVDASGLSVVGLEWHALVDSAVTLKETRN